MRGATPELRTSRPRSSFLLLWWSIVCTAFAAPSITSIVVEPDPLVVGAEVVVKVQGQNIAGGVVFIDFRPAVARMLRFTLAQDGGGWSATGTIPADLNLTADGQAIIRVYVSDATSSQATQTKTVLLKTRSAGFRIAFDQPAYTASPATSITARVLIQGAPLPRLFSYAIEAEIVATNTLPANVVSVVVPAALNFNGPRSGGALVGAGQNKALVKGTVNFFASPIVYYAEALLATVNISGLPAGSYTLTLKGYPTLGPTEALFVDSELKVLDPSITYGTATVVVASTSPLGMAEAPSSTLAAARATASAFPAGNSGNDESSARVDHMSSPLLPNSFGAEFTVQSGLAAIAFSTVAGEEYVIERSLDRQTWITCIPTIVGDGNVVNWVDHEVPYVAPVDGGSPTWVYRVSKVSPSASEEGQ